MKTINGFPPRKGKGRQVLEWVASRPLSLCDHYRFATTIALRPLSLALPLSWEKINGRDALLRVRDSKEGEAPAGPRSRKLPVKSGSAGASPSQCLAFEIRL